MTKIRQVSDLLQQITDVMKQQGLWSEIPPAANALASDQPFAIDSLSAPQWLQWIFLEKMQQLIANDMPLMANLSISPYFEEALPSEHGQLLVLLHQLEQIINQPQPMATDGE